MDNSVFIIKVLFGGLGDMLFYSHLPRIAHELGYTTVLISNRSECRHPDYKKLVWDMNPYVNGYTDEDADYPLFSTIDEGMNLLDTHMLKRGLDDGKRFHEPEIYYQPKLIEAYKDKIIYDGNFVSYVGKINGTLIAKHLRKKPNLLQMQYRKGIMLKGVKEISTPTIFDYCDLIYSCKEFYCLTSGGATLAAAMRKPATVFYGTRHNPMFRHSPLHTYIRMSDPEPIRVIKKLFTNKDKKYF
ncbi:hypothetical protein [Ferruginibacter albus]|uniref:hypothetical protein n=1 Tax=Ferruginibacter albus TaxID=2875540 RepID=UPI001CC6D340|nr:hypothetical protein [Ferruginibacter albus]UAY50997.1 hypothetical protein K9M53_10395 [Ferruginibacter albus]